MQLRALHTIHHSGKIIEAGEVIGIDDKNTIKHLENAGAVEKIKDAKEIKITKDNK